MKAQFYKGIDVQGHRGARGHMPENSIPGFIYALEIGVSTLEMDVVIARDKTVIVSHDPYISEEICLLNNDAPNEESHNEKVNIYTLDYTQIKKFDCGSKFFDRFPEQKKISVFKPSLSDVVHAVEAIGSKHLYNIEIKSRPEWDDSYHPPYQEFAELLIAELIRLNIMNRTTVQSFDVRTLKYIHENHPYVELVYLIENENGFERNIELLGFKPEVYSPYHRLVDENLLQKCRSANIKLIPWTVNEREDMDRLIRLGVDGIISDYPMRLINAINQSDK